MDGKDGHTDMKKLLSLLLLFTLILPFVPPLANAHESLSSPPRLPAGELTAERINFTGGRNYPVYSGPGAGYERGANGEASVSTNDWIQVFGEENGYIMIQYGVGITSSTRLRVGWIEKSALPKSASVRKLSFYDMPAEITASVSMTDDPLESRTAVRTLYAGEKVIYLSSLGNDAYIETEDGKIRGFVPMSAVTLRGASKEYKPEDLAGEWFMWAGGNFLFDYVTFGDNGFFWAEIIDGEQGFGVNTNFDLIRRTAWLGGTYTVEPYDLSERAFWNDPAYALTLYLDDGSVRRYGLEFSLGHGDDPDAAGRDCITISDNGGSGGYLRFR